jgi:predicted GNAT superfamily acetyltransferase
MTEAAIRAAEAAARTALVQVRDVDEPDDLAAICRLFKEIWRPEPENPPATPELLRALVKAGNYVAGAFHGADLAGACVGFCGPPAAAELHSHIAGVAPAVPGRGVGFALKLHQRAWAMQRGVSRIAWTFDPLIRRNAWFNLAKLGTGAAEYLPNFYGDMNDAINGRGETDRLLVRWDLASTDVVAACDGKVRAGDAAGELARGAVVALGRSAQGWPAAGTLTAGTLTGGTLTGGTLLVAVPPDVEALRLTDPACAARWRIAVRDVLGTALGKGGRVTGFDKSGWYIVASQEDRCQEDR